MDPEEIIRMRQQQIAQLLSRIIGQLEIVSVQLTTLTSDITAGMNGLMAGVNKVLDNSQIHASLLVDASTHVTQSVNDFRQIQQDLFVHFVDEPEQRAIDEVANVGRGRPQNQDSKNQMKKKETLESPVVPVDRIISIIQETPSLEQFPRTSASIHQNSSPSSPSPNEIGLTFSKPKEIPLKPETETETDDKTIDFNLSSFSSINYEMSSNLNLGIGIPLQLELCQPNVLMVCFSLKKLCLRDRESRWMESVTKTISGFNWALKLRDGGIFGDKGRSIGLFLLCKGPAANSLLVRTLTGGSCKVKEPIFKVHSWHPNKEGLEKKLGDMDYTKSNEEDNGVWFELEQKQILLSKGLLVDDDYDNPSKLKVSVEFSVTTIDSSPRSGNLNSPTAASIFD